MGNWGVDWLQTDSTFITEFECLNLRGLSGKYQAVLNMMYVWPCIIYENDERYQLDATIMIYYHK